MTDYDSHSICQNHQYACNTLYAYIALTASMDTCTTPSVRTMLHVDDTNQNTIYKSFPSPNNISCYISLTSNGLYINA